MRKAFDYNMQPYGLSQRFKVVQRKAMFKNLPGQGN